VTGVIANLFLRPLAQQSGQRQPLLNIQPAESL